MNTGVCDAFDLAWKLAAILQGFGGPRLLESYERERRPIGQRNLEASRRHNDVRVAIGSLYNSELEIAGPDGELARSRAADKIKSLGNAENESYGTELGYRYNDSPIICSVPREEPEDPLRYIPKAIPGARLPSVFLANGKALFDLLGPWFTVLAADPSACETLVAAAQRRRMPLRVIAFNEPDFKSIYEAPMVLVRPDQHVAWEGCSLDPVAAESVVSRALGWI
jgi:hypothetical protein